MIMEVSIEIDILIYEWIRTAIPMRIIITNLGVGSYDFGAFFAGVGEELFVASDAVGMFLSEDVGLSGQRLVAVPTAEVLRVEFLVHGSRVLAREDQLKG